MFNIYKFYSNDLEIFLSIVLIPLFMILIYNFIKSHGKLYVNIFKMKTTFVNKNNWQENNNEFSNNTKWIELDFILQLYNHKNNFNSIYNIDVYVKRRLKYRLIENHYLNLTDTVKSVSGTNTYEKLQYVNFYPLEIKEFKIKVKLNNEEFKNIKKCPIVIIYRNGRKKKKIKLKKFLKSDKKK